MAAQRENLWHIFSRGTATQNLVARRHCTAQPMYIPYCLRICNDRDVWLPSFWKIIFYFSYAPCWYRVQRCVPSHCRWGGKRGRSTFHTSWRNSSALVCAMIINAGEKNMLLWRGRNLVLNNKLKLNLR